MPPAGLLSPPPPPRRPPSRGPARQASLVRNFKKAWQAGNIDALIALLDPGATVTADGGGRASAAPRPVQGAEQVARYLTGITARAPAAVTFLERTVNGQPGLIAQQRGITVTVFAFDVTDNRITRIWAIRNPDKLRPWTTR
jgi:hypothetical protein